MAHAELLGPDGPFARTLSGYEVRPGQVAMAEAVEAALTEERVLLCEAGTGTGKTMAYLVPAILSGKKVVVSTATRALQDQIFTKDIPLIERALGRSAHAALMKGLPNYLCRRRFDEFRSSAEASRPSVAASLAAVERWATQTESGDVAELAGLSEDDPVFSSVTSSSDTRLGASCQYYDECFVTRMKREADAARLVVVNHHLFFADLALRGAHPGRVLPDYDAVIFDEAHQLEDVATTFFGVRVSEARVARLVRDVEQALGRLSGAGSFAGASIVSGAANASATFFGVVTRDARGLEGRATLERDFWTGERQTAFHALDDSLEALGALAESTRGRLEGGASLVPSRRDALAVAEALAVSARRAEELRRDLSLIVDGAKERVTWFDASSRSASLSSSPVDLAGTFRTRVFETVPASILTSATLSNGKNGDSGPKAFAFIRSRLGLDGDTVSVAEAVVPSPFDYTTHALLYLPDDLPPPGDPEFVARATERIAELVEITRGGAFVLTTSLRSMHALHRGLTARLRGYPILVQGEAPKTAVLERFRSRQNAVLVATASFWQGVDVPGQALRLVVLEKIPFPVPNEPVIAARSLALESEGRKPFMELHVPIAKIALKQGFGRLIRTRADRGIVALLDERVHRRGYGKDLAASLPPAARATELSEVRAFWEHAALADAGATGNPEVSLDAGGGRTPDSL